MALTITATITVNDDEAYTAREAAILAAFQAHPAQGITLAPVVITNPAEDKAEEAAPAAETEPEKPKRTRRTPKAAPAPESEESTTPAALDTTLDEVPDDQAIAEAEAAEDLLGDTEPKEYTLDDVIAVGTKFLKAGKQAEVKAALAKAGNFSRVSELKGAEAFATFITALEG